MAVAINCFNFSASNPGYLGMILHPNGSGCLCRESALHSLSSSLSCTTHIATPVENLGSAGISTPFSSRGQGLQYLGYCQHLGHGHPNGHVYRISPDTNASTSKRDMFNVVGFERAIVIDESLGYEHVWLRELRLVVPST